MLRTATGDKKRSVDGAELGDEIPTRRSIPRNPRMATISRMDDWRLRATIEPEGRDA